MMNDHDHPFFPIGVYLLGARLIWNFPIDQAEQERMRKLSRTERQVISESDLVDDDGGHTE